MSLTADLALVTACRDALAKATPGPWAWDGMEALCGDTENTRTGFWTPIIEVEAWVGNDVEAALIAAAPTVYGAALSLIEDTLNRHTFSQYHAECNWCSDDVSVEWPCPDYRGAVTALHTIATALGVET